MNLGEFSIKKSVITWALTLVLVAAGWSAFGKLARLEDPEFTIKQAIISTPYPGASAAEVEKEVSDLIELVRPTRIAAITVIPIGYTQPPHEGEYIPYHIRYRSRRQSELVLGLHFDNAVRNL